MLYSTNKVHSIYSIQFVAGASKISNMSDLDFAWSFEIETSLRSNLVAADCDKEIIRVRNFVDFSIVE